MSEIKNTWELWPQDGHFYYYLDSKGNVHRLEYRDLTAQGKHFYRKSMGLCHKTKREAELFRKFLMSQKNGQWQVTMKLVESNAELVKALEFYAKPENHYTRTEDAGCGCCSDIRPSLIEEDSGKLAQQALNKAKGVNDEKN